MSNGSSRPIAYWLLACCFMVFATTVVGGVTRLTRSGLSIVEWQPVMGTIPPLSEGDWLEAFAKYRESPEYRKVNEGMTLGEFKFIFWWEWGHRLLGRSIGVVFLLPLVWFVVRRRVDRVLVPRLFAFLGLGALQGLLGWYMVRSGLVDDPWVSPYRLTAHLGLAFLIFALMLWTALDLLRARTATPSAPVGVRRLAAGVVGVVYLMVLTGGLVAGLRAGYAYNTFPLMNGYLVPPGMWELTPWWMNFFNNITTVQFDHRLFAGFLSGLGPWLWWRVRGAVKLPRARLAADLMLAMIAVQVTLGIATLLQMVPVAWAAAHQAGAMLLLGAVLWVNHELRVGA